MIYLKVTRIILALSLILATICSHADTLNIAVASNFSHTMRALAKNFNANTGHELRISSASTGKLYVQIINGAPFDVFLAADESRPDKLITKGKARAEFSRIYALGKLIMISNIKPKKRCQDILTSSTLKRLAIANPRTAPYGIASQQVLKKLNLWESIKPKLVMGENIAQTLHFISTENATAGFVAKSILQQGTDISLACKWDVPDNMHNPIKQKMVILTTAANKPVSKSFWEYMHTDMAKRIITNSGYDVP